MTTHCDEYGQLTRRGFLQNGMAAAGVVLGQSLLPEWMPALQLADPIVGQQGDTLVCIFLRGGSDGLNMIVPHGDDDYYAARPNLAIARPDQAGSSAIDLDGFFGLHPALTPFSDLYGTGDLAFVHASGVPDGSRSHFVAQASMEQGVGTDFTGWLGRHLATLDTQNLSPLRAVGVGNLLAMSLRGDVPATVMQSAEAYRLQLPDAYALPMETLLQGIYAQPNLLSGAATQTLATIDIVEGVQGTPVGAYGDSTLGLGLRTVAQLVKADVGVEVATIDYGGWDTHAAQGAGSGQMADLMATLAAELSTFYADMQDKMNNITVVVMSEFGRRVGENGSGGTDHGAGGVMTLLGGGINGGNVFSQWPGLAPGQLVAGDLAVTIDYRDVLGEILTKRLNNPQLDLLFPGHMPTQHGVAL